ncbi:zinc-binding dehydrogenase [Sphingomonas arenae]|uniref:zinc-binding dehydrogenase n=1 Tax=Sphingomonas arenae TaxID=2812555 RepID=UPI0019673371|nr:zinc-binding dehydrogenase [Sphingomonas arenae]
MMRAAVLRDRRIAVEERARPEPGPGQVLLKIRLCGICGSDLHLAKHAAEIAKLGEEFGAPPQDLSRGLILGHEFIGEIAEFGPETARTLQIGDRVVSVPFLLENGVPKPIGASVDVAGAYAEYMLASEALLLKVPDEVPDEAAALVEPLAIAWHAVAKSGLPPVDAAAVVLGCGPIGLAIVTVLKMHGVEGIVASDFSPRRRELATTLGAAQAISPKDGNALAAAAAASPGKPLVIYDCTGAQGVLGVAVRDAAAGTRIVVAGIAHGEETINPMLGIAKELSIQFVVYYTPEEFAATLQAVADGRLQWRPLLSATIGLNAVDDAFRLLEDPERHAKILIAPWSDAGLPA